MTSLPEPRVSAAAALIHGTLATASTFAWYAMPDAIRCWKGRAVAKAGLATLIAANEVVYLRPTIAYAKDVLADEGLCCCGQGGCESDVEMDSMESPFLGSAVMDVEDVAVDCASRPNLGDLDDAIEYPTEPPACHQPSLLPTAAKIAAVVGAVTAVGAGVVFAERGIFRRGERRSAEGVSYAHTRQAVGLAAVSAVLCAADYVLDVMAGNEEDELV